MWFSRKSVAGRRKQHFLPKEKNTKYWENSYPEDSERAKRTIEGNINKANLSLEKLIPWARWAGGCGESKGNGGSSLVSGLTHSLGGLSMGKGGQSLNNPASTVPWKKQGKPTKISKNNNNNNNLESVRVFLCTWELQGRTGTVCVWFEFSPKRSFLCLL